MPQPDQEETQPLITMTVPLVHSVRPDAAVGFLQPAGQPFLHGLKFTWPAGAIFA